MKFLFIVQGEGRGHLTQAIALRDMLERNGHQVVGAMVGKSKQRELPEFFLKKMKTNLYRFTSPNFLPSPKHKRTNIWITIGYNVVRIPAYLSSIFYIRKIINHLDADVVVNFYDMMAGFAYALFPPRVPYLAVSHQYLFLHPDYKFPPQESAAELYMLRLYTRITCMNASRKLALAMAPVDNVPDKKLFIVPPLIRKEVLNASVTDGNYLHGYLLNVGYAEDIIAFQKLHPEAYMRFFWDKKEAEPIEEINDHLSFYRLNDELFIQSMAGCRAYATTAGFESVCEAMYMGKPVLMVPTHVEQACNAYEASLAGAGVVSDSFDLEKLMDYEKEYRKCPEFRAWVDQSEERWMKAINDFINGQLIMDN